MTKYNESINENNNILMNTLKDYITIRLQLI